MGSTVSTEKHVSALKTSDGRIAYFLYESTYEKNCYPHTPSWSCVGAGYLAEVFTRLMCLASCCEGGMLQTRSGSITPEGYLKGWFKAMAEPSLQPNREVTLAFGDQFSSKLPISKTDIVLAALERLGRLDAIAALRCGDFDINLQDDFDIVNALCGNGGVAPWRIIGCGSPRHFTRAPDLAYLPVAAKAPALALPIARRGGDGDNILIQGADGSFYAKGWAYSIVGRFVEAYGPTEQLYPGSYKAAFPAYRAAVRGARQAPTTALITISLDDAVDSDDRQKMATFIEKMGGLGPTLTVRYEDVLKADLHREGYHFSHYLFRLDAARWEIPAEQLDEQGQNQLALVI